MISFTQNVRNALMNRPTDYFHMLEIKDKENNTWKATTTLPYDIALSDGSSFVSDLNTTIMFDPPKMSSSVDREQYKITLSDPSMTAVSTLENSVLGFKVKVRLGFLDYQTKMPLSDITDTILIYAGRIDGASYVIKTQESGDIILQLTCASPMADLDLKKALWTSRDFVRSRNPEDSSCDQVYGGSGALQLKWGKV